MGAAYVLFAYNGNRVTNALGCYRGICKQRSWHHEDERSADHRCGLTWLHAQDEVSLKFGTALVSTRAVIAVSASRGAGITKMSAVLTIGVD